MLRRENRDFIQLFNYFASQSVKAGNPVNFISKELYSQASILIRGKISRTSPETRNFPREKSIGFRS
jgi:hypothetical protein